MKIKIHSIDGKGDLEREVVWIKVVQDVSDLTYYMVCDTTYTDDNHISNELRHVYWFPKKAVQAEDWIALRTKEGKNGAAKNNSGTSTYTFYWNLSRTIWNKSGDAAVLFKLETWKTTRA